MARNWKSRQAPPPTSITEIARRYHAAAVALAQTLGLSVPEVLSAHRESVTAIFIECGRCDLRLPGGVKLAPLVQPNGQAPENLPTEDTEVLREDRPLADPSTNGTVAETATGVAIPTTIPTGWPSGGQVLAALKPATLHMLIAKTAALVHAEGAGWVPLLASLQAERARRLERGRKAPREG